MNFSETIKFSFRNFLNIQPRVSRAQIWWWFLFSIIGSLITAYIDMILGNAGYLTGPIFSYLFGVVFIFIWWMLLVGRLRDVKYSGWWLLLVFIPVGLPVILFMVFFLRGTPGENKYGKDPYDLDT